MKVVSRFAYFIFASIKGGRRLHGKREKNRRSFRQQAASAHIAETGLSLNKKEFYSVSYTGIHINCQPHYLLIVKLIDPE
jgi:hypothetical protein